MKKNLYLTIVCVLFSVVFVMANTETALWSENFEGDWTANWYVDAGTWEVGIPTSGPNAAHTGDKCAATVLGGNYPANANTRLIRFNTFTVPSANQNPRLRFWHWYSFASADQGTVQIKVGTGDWETISETYINTGSAVWTYSSIDLSSYAGLSVQLAFLLKSDGSGYTVSTGWYIDDIEVVSGPIVFNNPETWESGLGDWYPDLGTWEVGTPSSGPGSAHTDQKCAATVLNGNYHASVNSRLISPQFTVPSANQNPRLRFWHWYSFASADQGTVQIKVGTG
ncbi:MAG TPA: hypothetical protein VLQ91_14055, partial [Draconibacterium sp.]|nr:hypothetical protein [Draconibacterium sp.]